MIKKIKFSLYPSPAGSQTLAYSGTRRNSKRHWRRYNFKGLRPLAGRGCGTLKRVYKINQQPVILHPRTGFGDTLEEEQGEKGGEDLELAKSNTFSMQMKDGRFNTNDEAESYKKRRPIERQRKKIFDAHKSYIWRSWIIHHAFQKLLPLTLINQMAKDDKI